METYQETIAWMFSKLPMFQRKGAAAYRPGLEAMQQLDQYLGNPHQAYPCIHIGGTNGKGSTAHMMVSVLQTAGFKTGLYTSPHLLDFRERIKVGGQLISKQEVVEFVTSHKPYFEKAQLSFFEMTVGLALWYFKKEKVDYAIIEVGLGGRLDATNIITPVLSVITNIGLDHTQFLGTIHATIAREKAGIIKPKIPVVIGEKDPRTQAVFEEVAQHQGAPLSFAEQQNSPFFSDLTGSYQKKNIRTVVAALEQLHLGLEDEIVQKGLLNVKEATQLMGRWQKIRTTPEVILDVAHNKEGLTLVAKQIKTLSYGKLHLVMGFVQGREVQDLLSLFPSSATFYLSSPNLERALPLTQLKEELVNSPLHIQYFQQVLLAYQAALEEAAPEDLIFVGGSTFVVAEVLEYEKNNSLK